MPSEMTLRATARRMQAEAKRLRAEEERLEKLADDQRARWEQADLRALRAKRAGEEATLAARRARADAENESQEAASLRKMANILQRDRNAETDPKKIEELEEQIRWLKQGATLNERSEEALLKDAKSADLRRAKFEKEAATADAEVEAAVAELEKLRHEVGLIEREVEQLEADIKDIEAQLPDKTAQFTADDFDADATAIAATPSPSLDPADLDDIDTEVVGNADHLPVDDIDADVLLERIEVPSAIAAPSAPLDTPDAGIAAAVEEMASPLADDGLDPSFSEPGPLTADAEIPIEPSEIAAEPPDQPAAEVVDA